MTLDGYVAHRLLRNPSTRHAETIWISDKLLVESIERFTCVHRRYGSSVPGPLESRRRSTRRKNTSLAPAAYETPPIEVGTLFGPSKKTEWWNFLSSVDLQPVVCDREFSILAIYFYPLTICSSGNTTFLAHLKTASVASERPCASVFSAS